MTIYRIGSEKRSCKLKPIYKSRSRKQILNMVRDYIKCQVECEYVYKELIAKELQLKQYEVEQALHLLNLKGLVNQPQHIIQHDRPYGGSGWCADRYKIRNNNE